MFTEVLIIAHTCCFGKDTFNGFAMLLPPQAEGNYSIPPTRKNTNILHCFGNQFKMMCTVTYTG